MPEFTPELALEYQQLYDAALVRGGFPAQWGRGDTLRNTLARTLRSLAAEHKLKKQGSGRGKGASLAYSVIRPSLKVTKSAKANA